MSADNWTICPKCKSRDAVLNEARILAPAKAYGKVSPDAYAKLLEQAQNLIQTEDTLREDYEIGIRNGKFSVDYCASCQACDFIHKFKYEEDLVAIHAGGGG